MPCPKGSTKISSNFLILICNYRIRVVIDSSFRKFSRVIIYWDVFPSFEGSD